MAKSPAEESSNPLLLNAAIGFLGVLLLILLFALGTRLLYPRIVAERAVEDPVLISRVIQLEVLNGCGVSGIANQFTDKLRRFGFDVVETGNFDHFNVQNTKIVSRSGNMEDARRIAEILGIEPQHVLREESPDFYLDVTLIIGEDFESLNLN
ncbi:MAG: LytR family transcriptional regulator [Bacteroidetes bacterium]|jgi:hypothetical protein|nr:LytR family transcriptional regulator [Bacteroidota bacterium]